MGHEGSSSIVSVIRQLPVHPTFKMVNGGQQTQWTPRRGTTLPAIDILIGIAFRFLHKSSKGNFSFNNLVPIMIWSLRGIMKWWLVKVEETSRLCWIGTSPWFPILSSLLVTVGRNDSLSAGRKPHLAGVWEDRTDTNKTLVQVEFLGVGGGVGGRFVTTDYKCGELDHKDSSRVRKVWSDCPPSNPIAAEPLGNPSPP